MALKAWQKVIDPRPDLCEGRPLDASEFAVHLDQVRDQRAMADYQDPERFFRHTYLTANLKELAAGVLRRLSGVKVETSAAYNLATQFGGGKTHALTLLYHLAQGGAAAKRWAGVEDILEKAGVRSIPKIATAVFVGTEFDSLAGRGGTDGTPKRRTPWGEIAFQLGGAEAFKEVAKHDETGTAPGTEVIRKFLPSDRATLILMDEVMNFVSRGRKSGLADQLLAFVNNLLEEARGQDNVVAVISVPASELEMGAEDHADYTRLAKVLDRLAKPMVMSAGQETAEIIRRRLFEWDGVPTDAEKVAAAYAEWVGDHRTQLPSTFPVDGAKEAFLASYPFHPTLLSVFERKWQALPRFQRTRGVLRLLALWVSHACQRGQPKDPLITLGSAPLDDVAFRTALFEQLGEAKLEAVVTTDICGKKDSHAACLDREAVETLRAIRLHQKAATTIFFESNGGQLREEATIPEIRLAVGAPELDIGNVETALDALSGACYYLASGRNSYHFSLQANLNKLLADRRANVRPKDVADRVRAEVMTVFGDRGGVAGHVERAYFPEKSEDIGQQPALTLVVLAPERSGREPETRTFIDAATREAGASARTYKSALVWAVADGPDTLHDEARKLLAWEQIADEAVDLRLDDSQRKQLTEYTLRAKRDLRETVWRSYKTLVLLDKKNEWNAMDLGLLTSSSGPSLAAVLVERLRKVGDVEVAPPSPDFLIRNWPAMDEWSTRAVRDAFFASPRFPRLIDGDHVRQTIAKGVAERKLAYVGHGADDRFDPFYFGADSGLTDVEISDDLFIIRGKAAEIYEATRRRSSIPPPPDPALIKAGDASNGSVTTGPATGPSRRAGTPAQRERNIPRFTWEGDVPPLKWMNFYTKVLSRFTTTADVKLTVRVQVSSPSGISEQAVGETKGALRDVGLTDDLRPEPD